MVIKLSDYRTMGEEENLSLREIMASETAVAFDNCTQIAIHIAQAPIAYISLIDASCQWLKSQVGLQAKTHHYLDFCERVIALHYTSRQTAKYPQPETPSSTETKLSTSEEMLSAIVIEDLAINNSINKQLATHPLVKSDPGIRFYIGIPIQTNEGVLVGMLSVMDYEPRPISTDSLNALKRKFRV
jgi:GAF domain-containing protein